VLYSVKICNFADEKLGLGLKALRDGDNICNPLGLQYTDHPSRAPTSLQVNRHVIFDGAMLGKMFERNVALEELTML